MLEPAFPQRQRGHVDMRFSAWIARRPEISRRAHGQVSANLHLREGLRESSLESNHAKFGMRSPAFQYALLFFVEPSHGEIAGFWYMSSSKSNDIP